MSRTTFTPREGSKSALAMTALLDGPMSNSEMAAAIDAAVDTVAAHLNTCIKNDVVIRMKDASGAVHYALKDASVPDGFTVAPPKPSPFAPPNPAQVNAFPSNPFSQMVAGAIAAKSPELEVKEDPPTPEPGKTKAVIKVTPPAHSTETSFNAGRFLDGTLQISHNGTTITLPKLLASQLITFLIPEAAEL